MKDIKYINFRIVYKFINQRFMYIKSKRANKKINSKVFKSYNAS